MAQQGDDASSPAGPTDARGLALELVRAWIDNKPARWTSLVTTAHDQGPREVVEALGGLAEMLLSRIAARAGSREMMEVLADQVALLLVRIAHQTGSTPKVTLDRILAESAGSPESTRDAAPPPPPD